MNCLNCNVEFGSKRKDTKFCSSRCKLQTFRKDSIETDNVTLKSIPETDNFKFYTISKANSLGREEEDENSKIRETKYWYDVPLSAIPVKQKDWPDMPDWMNGRQYFLWWKNNFEENGQPVILNPFPVHDNVRVELGGESSRRWGA